MGKMLGDRRGAAAISAALLAILLASCGRPSAERTTRDAPAANAAAATNAAAPGAKPANAAAPATEPAAAASNEEGSEAGTAEASRPASRSARCQVDDGPVGACTFTPVMGDGSFEVEAPDRHLRLVVDGGEAVAFDIVGSRRILLAGVLLRDPDDRACWVGQDEESILSRVCAW